jgi:hypothetical protein
MSEPIPQGQIDAANAYETLMVPALFGEWASEGRRRMRARGWTAALMANSIWIYSLTFTLVRDLHVGLTAGTVFFLAFALFAMVSTAYLWVRRSWFWPEP